MPPLRPLSLRDTRNRFSDFSLAYFSPKDGEAVQNKKLLLVFKKDPPGLKKVVGTAKMLHKLIMCVWGG